MTAELSDEVKVLAKQFSMVMGSLAIVITYDNYYDFLELMKTGPPDANMAIKMEVDEEEDIKQPVADPTRDVEPMDVETENAHDAVDQLATGSETPDPNVSDIESVANKKRRIGCWINHPDNIKCPRNLEQTALIKAFMHLERGGEPSEQPS